MKKTTKRPKLAKATSALKLWLLMSAVIFTSNIQATEDNIITFGVVPQQSASKLARSWGPILSQLTKDTGLKFQFKTAPSIPVFEQRVAAGEYDIAYMNPYHYTEFSKSPGYRAFAKAKNKSIRGIIVVRKDSPISNLQDFDQQAMAFPAPAAFAASVLPRAQLVRDEINVTPKYVSSHDSVYMAVARGIYVGGGGVKRTFAMVDPEIRDQLKILWTTEPYSSHPLAAHPRLDPLSIEKITESLVALEQSEHGQNLLKQLAWKGVEPADDQRWDDVRGLGLELLSELVEQ